MSEANIVLVDFKPGYCPNCLHTLRIEHDVCPECGVDPSQLYARLLSEKIIRQKLDTAINNLPHLAVILLALILTILYVYIGAYQLSGIFRRSTPNTVLAYLIPSVLCLSCCIAGFWSGKQVRQRLENCFKLNGIYGARRIVFVIPLIRSKAMLLMTCFSILTIGMYIPSVIRPVARDSEAMHEVLRKYEWWFDGVGGSILSLIALFFLAYVTSAVKQESS